MIRFYDISHVRIESTGFKFRNEERLTRIIKESIETLIKEKIEPISDEEVEILIAINGYQYAPYYEVFEVKSLKLCRRSARQTL